MLTEFENDYRLKTRENEERVAAVVDLRLRLLAANLTEQGEALMYQQFFENVGVLKEQGLSEAAARITSFTVMAAYNGRRQ